MRNSINSTPNSPKYNTVKREKNNKFIKKENSLTRQKSMTGYNMHKSYNAYDRNEIDSKHEHCLNWLKAGNSYEKESKELDANIQLLMWKKRHLEILQKQKIKEMQSDGCGKLHDSSTASDSPPPLSDFFKPELSSVSADDGFESAVGAVNNQVNLQHISYLESELKRRDLRIEMYEGLMPKKNLRNNLSEDLFPTRRVSSRHSTLNNNYTCLQDLRSSPNTCVLPTSRSFFSDQPLNNYRTSTPEAKTPIRPNSFKTDLLSSHRSNTLPHSNIKSSQSFHHFNHNSYQQNLNNSFLTPQSHRNFPSQSVREGRVGPSSMELLKVKSELLVKDQDLRKMRGVLKELSGRYNELLEQHMKLLQSQQNSRRSQLTSPNASRQDEHPYVANSSLEHTYVGNNGREETPLREDLREELVELISVLKHQRLSSPFPETPSKLQERSGRCSSNNKDTFLLLHTLKQLRTNLYPGSKKSPHHHENDLEYYLRPQ